MYRCLNAVSGVLGVLLDHDVGAKVLLLGLDVIVATTISCPVTTCGILP